VSVPYVYDAGALIAIDANDRRMWAIHSVALEEGRRVVVPAVVVGQVWRNGPRHVRLGRVLRSCEIQPVGLEVSKAAGVLCGRVRTCDVVDAIVVVVAASLGAIVFTSDPGDIFTLADGTGGLAIRKV
jgi:hypothetical protein